VEVKELFIRTPAMFPDDEKAERRKPFKHRRVDFYKDALENQFQKIVDF